MEEQSWACILHLKDLQSNDMLDYIVAGEASNYDPLYIVKLNCTQTIDTIRL